ncbi:MAG: hypothetical protein VB853_06245 [Pirellulales bacterium]
MAKKKKKGPFQKQRANVYTMMLICSFLALVLGCVLMYLELKRYDFDMEAKEYQVQRPVAAQAWANTA